MHFVSASCALSQSYFSALSDYYSNIENKEHQFQLNALFYPTIFSNLIGHPIVIHFKTLCDDVITAFYIELQQTKKKHMWLNAFNIACKTRNAFDFDASQSANRNNINCLMKQNPIFIHKVN